MDCMKLLVCASLLTTVACVLGWTTVTSSPTSVADGAATFLSPFAFWIKLTYTHRYDPSADVWTSLNPMPTSRHLMGIGVGGSLAYSFGGHDGTGGCSTGEAFDTSGNWATVTPMPTPRRRISGSSDGWTLWFVCGKSPTGSPMDVHEEYQSATDTWTTRKTAPAGRVNHASSYSNGFVVMLGANGPALGSDVAVYRVAQDTWTTGTPVPSARVGVQNSGAAIAGYHFIIGGSSPGPLLSLETYSVLSDTWTTAGHAPVVHSEGVAMLSSGVLLLFGSPTTTTAHLFTDYMIASLMADPYVSDFDGLARHVALRTGVFNLVTTPTVVVNAVVERLSTRPAEDDTVVTMVGVSVAHTDGLFLCDCVCSQPTEQTACGISFVAASSGYEVPSSLPYFTDSNRLELHANDLIVMVESVSEAVLVDQPNAGPLFYRPTRYFNVFVRHSEAGSSLGGLLANLTNVADITPYEVSSGCLHATEVPATAGLFSPSSPVRVC